MKKVLILIAVMCSLPSFADEQRQTLDTFCSFTGGGYDCLVIQAVCRRHMASGWSPWTPYMVSSSADYQAETDYMGGVRGYGITLKSSTIIYSYNGSSAGGGTSWLTGYVITNHKYAVTYSNTFMAAFGPAIGISGGWSTDFSRDASWRFG